MSHIYRDKTPINFVLLGGKSININVLRSQLV